MNPCCLDIARAGELTFGRQVGKEHLYTCPRHHDQHPSLSINARKNVWLCGPCGKGGSAWELEAFILGVDPNDKQTITAWLKDKCLLESNGNGRRIIAIYDYRDEKGNLLYQGIRYAPKDFRQRRPDGNGGW